MVDSSDPNFDVAKQRVIYGLEKLVKFSRNMHNKYPTCGFAQFVQRLSDLEKLIEIASGPCLSCNQIDEIEGFAQHLSSNQCFIHNYFSFSLTFSLNCVNFGIFVKVFLIRVER